MRTMHVAGCPDCGGAEDPADRFLRRRGREATEGLMKELERNGGANTDAECT